MIMHLEDLLEMYSDKNVNYLGHVGLPTYAHVYSVDQLNLLKTLNSNMPITGYLDATGTIIRKMNKEHKRILYYVLVTSFKLPCDSGVKC